MLKECRTMNAETHGQQLQWKEQGKGEDHIKDGGMRLERI